MTREWFYWINYTLAIFCALFLLGALWYKFAQPSHIESPSVVNATSALPKNPFTQPQESYDAIGDPVFSLKFSPPSTQLPNLQTQLVYFGRNSRPDSNEKAPAMHFSLNGNKSFASIPSGGRLYLFYDRSLSPPRYVFSPDNVETPVWIEPRFEGNMAVINVSMKSETGEIVRKPSKYAQFTLPEKDSSRVSGGFWELGKLKVDGTLLARQKARWYGTDVFLEKHGGDEFKEFSGNQRIDFGEGEDAYSIFISDTGCVIWDHEQNRWREVTKSIDSTKYPLMCVKKIDNRIMTLDLWDAGGKARIALNMLKSMESAISPKNFEKDFKFEGARTLSQFVFIINNERVLLSPYDWLLQTKEGWKKLETPEEIDDYVNRKITGVLFVLDGVEKRDDKQVLVGTIFNPSRTEMQTIEIPISQNVLQKNSPQQDHDHSIQPSKPVQIKMPNPENVAPSPSQPDPDEDESEDEVEREEK